MFSTNNAKSVQTNYTTWASVFGPGGPSLFKGSRRTPHTRTATHHKNTLRALYSDNLHEVQQLVNIIRVRYPISACASLVTFLDILGPAQRAFYRNVESSVLLSPGPIALYFTHCHNSYRTSIFGQVPPSGSSHTADSAIVAMRARYCVIRPNNADA